MLDSEVFDGDDEDTDATAEDSSAEGADSSDGGSPDEKSDEGADAKVVSLEDFLKDNPEAQKDLDKHVQSGADKRFETARRKTAADNRRRTKQVDATRDAQERAELADKGEFETLGKRTASDDSNKIIFNDAAQQVAGFIEETIRARPELIDALGEERITEIADKIRDNVNPKTGKTGDVIDFMLALNDAVSETRVGKAMEDQKENIKTEVAAALKDAGVQIRTEESDEGADEDLTRTVRSSSQKSWDDIQDGFIDGTVSPEAYEKAADARQKALQ